MQVMGEILGRETPVSSSRQPLVTIRGDAEKGTILEYTSYWWEGSCTALEALKGVLDQNGIST